MKPFEFLEHTADVKFRAFGLTPEEMLGNAALAMFNAMIDTSKVREERVWEVDLSGPDLEQLAYSWLSELVYLFDVEVAVFSRFEVHLVQSESEWKLHARIFGEEIDGRRHAFECQVKAVTLHQFEVSHNDHWTMQTILDV
ncbi:MAG: archease [Methanosarcinales archaeon]|nr:archease [Methanosarcinales archaeon]